MWLSCIKTRHEAWGFWDRINVESFSVQQELVKKGGGGRSYAGQLYGWFIPPSSWGTSWIKGPYFYDYRSSRAQLVGLDPRLHPFFILQVIMMEGLHLLFSLSLSLSQIKIKVRMVFKTSWLALFLVLMLGPTRLFHYLFYRFLGAFSDLLFTPPGWHRTPSELMEM
jgi:hypothetical protein